MEEFSAHFTADLPSLSDIATSLTKPMVEWLQAHLPPGCRDSYGGDTDDDV
jgi:hypothetical protein